MRYKLLLILFFFNGLSVFAHHGVEPDSILKNTFEASEKYNRLIEKYDAEVYMRTSIFTLKKNFLYKYTHFVPDFVLLDRKNDQGMIETFSTLRFHSPNNYEHNIKNINGTLTSKKDILMLPYNFLNINVYDINTTDERFIFPLRNETRNYYRYKFLNAYKKHDKTYYIFNYSPLYSSSKMLRGSFIIEDKTWRITQFSGVGNELFVDFKIEIEMGNDSLERFLPVKFKIYRTHLYLGNKVQNRYLASINYKTIIQKTTTESSKTFNIGNTHKVKLDSVQHKIDTVFWNSIRNIPFDNSEKSEYKKLTFEQYESALDTVNNRNKTVQLIAQSFISDTRYHYKKTDISYSGFLNPLMLSYSTQDGLNYRFRFSFKTHLIRDKFFSVSTYAGYALKYNDLVANLSSVIHYHPRRLGELTISVGKGNRSFSSLFINEVQDSLNPRGLTFTDKYVNYFKDYYGKIFNSIEVTNGLLLGVGIDYHIRQAMEKKNPLLESDEYLPPDSRRYFVPTIRLTWTPNQYYRKEGYEKIYLLSKYPTFKAEFARSFKNILGSTSEYNRFEFDMSQNVHFGLLQSLQYHLGSGFYTRQQTEYFADYTYFARYNLPETWADGIGGVFNLLPYSTYNASTSYIQAHVMYETPFFIFTLLPKLARGVLSERVYLSQLYTSHIQSYTEIGYGIGNRFINAAVFASFHKYTYQQIGGKVVFLLGK